MTDEPNAELPSVEPLAASTAHGLPYPLPSDPVAQGAAAIQALATELDKRIARALVAWRFASLVGIGGSHGNFVLDTIERDDFGSSSPTTT